MVSFICLTFSLVLSLTSGVSAQWQKPSLDLHNKYRTCHGVPSLALTDELNRSAQRCADYLASIKKMDHVCNQRYGTSYGENLASGTGGGLGNNAESSGLTSTRMWYNEEPKHDYNNNNFQYASGHFSQVVWKNSKQLGMGYGKNGNFAIIVAHYNPPGNYQGQFKQNVFRPNGNCS